ncbi:hypothetical protein ScPMuIL_001778 [Solemya velum]
MNLRDSMDGYVHLLLHAVLLYSVFSVAAGEEYLNLAQKYRKRVSQSSTYSPSDYGYTCYATHAVDGDTDQNVAHSHCSHTRYGAEAWWRIEFMGRVHIDRIVIYHRNENQDALRRFYNSRVFVSDINGCSGDQVYRQKEFPSTDIFNITTDAVGRYLSVCRNYGFVQLCEVEIFGCPNDRYGNQCNLTCGNCIGDTCSLSDGTCPGGCKYRYMGPMCDKPCDDGCTYSRCKKDGCEFGCVLGKHGTYCDLPCPTQCKNGTCNRHDGSCLECKKNMFWNPNCSAECSATCLDGVCAQDDGACSTGCESGYWGLQCNRTCPLNCEDGACDRSNGHCSNCTVGHWGNNCEKCSPNCLNSVCGQTEGRCTAGCRPGYYNSTCDKRCGHCVGNSCQRDNGVCDGGCRAGYWGSLCDVNCPVHCAVSCMQHTGVCDGDCRVGYWGDRCGDTCPDNCADSKCNRAGACISCLRGHWGQDCVLLCPPNCIDSTCDLSTGRCADGCIDGYQGQKCDDECDNGRYGSDCSGRCGSCQGGDNNCHHTNGTCLLGCIGKFVGHSCQNKEQAEDRVTLAVALSVVGLLLILACVALAVFIRDDNGTTETPLDKSISSLASEECLDSEPKCAPNVNSLKNDDSYYNISESSSGILVDDLKCYLATHNSDDYSEAFNKIPYGLQYPHAVGQHEENLKKNRFRGIYPYDHSRVVLGGDGPPSDYINANYIGGCKTEKEYIAAQGPKPDTVEDTWKMIVQEKCGKIVMLTNLKEKKKIKCEKYWPTAGESMELGDITLTLTSEEEFSSYSVRTINVMYTDKNKTETIMVQQFHFTAWPDHGIADPRQLIVFHRRVTQSNTSLPGPLLVHCSAGIGRTGTFIGLDALLTYGRLNGKIDISVFVTKMRRNRLNMVQTAAQFQLLHEALYEALMYPGSSIPRAVFFERFDKLEKQIQKEFQVLLKMLPEYSPKEFSESSLEHNKKKNRDLSILPHNAHRIILAPTHGCLENYINAVKVSGSVQNSQFLVTQLPLSDTIVDFWRMVSDHDSNVVVLLNPCEQGEQAYLIIFILYDFMYNFYIIVLKQIFQKTGAKREVKILFTTSWSIDEKLPPSKTLILDLIEYVDQWQQQQGVQPITVQCMDGVLCCGLYCAISKVIQLTRVDQEVDVFQVVREMQICRPEFLQSEVQYSFCYEVIQEYLAKAEDNVYVNF